MEDSDEWDEAWLGALGTLPEAVGPGELPKLNEGLRYLFKELRQAQAAFSNDNHLDGLFVIGCGERFPELVLRGKVGGSARAAHGTGERIVGA